jgi:MFS transporter, DHA1 family, multidrug resistance protein
MSHMQTTNNTKTVPRSFFVILVLMSMCGPLGMNIILPSMSSYQVIFDTDYASSQLTLTFYLVAVALGQLIYGPFSDRFGRRPIVLFGLSVMVVGTIIGLNAVSIEMLIFGRMVQAFGACSGMVMGRSMIRDKYAAEAAAAVIAYMTMAIVLAPTLGPLIGGLLEDLFGWQSLYAFMLLFGATILITAHFVLPETLPTENRQEARFSQLFTSFWHLFKNPTFCAYALQVAFSTSAYFAFLGGSSYVVVDLMGGTATELGLLFVAVSVFYVIGNFGTAKFSGRLGVYKVVMIGALITMIGPIALAVWELTIGLNQYSFFGFMCIVAVGNGLCISSGLAAAIGADPKRVGAASGLAGSLQIGLGALSTLCAGLALSYFETSVLPLIGVMMVCVTMSLIAFIVGTNMAKRR